MNDYYDYIVDDRIVSNKSLHGQYIKKIISAGKLDALNQKIENDPVLQSMGNPKEDGARKEGRKVRYELGSLVEFENYILTAFTNFDAACSIPIPFKPLSTSKHSAFFAGARS